LCRFAEDWLLLYEKPFCKNSAKNSFSQYREPAFFTDILKVHSGGNRDKLLLLSEKASVPVKEKAVGK